MRLRITVEPPRPGHTRAVVVDAPSGTTAAELARALGAAQLAVGRSVVPAGTRVGMPPLLDGAVVRLGGTRPTPPESGWELWAVSGPDAGLRFVVPPGSVLVGRSRHADVVLSDVAVSRRHALLEVAGNAVRLRDLGGTNGTRVCGMPLGSSCATLADGDVLEVGDSRLELRRTAPSLHDVQADGAGHLTLVPPARRKAPLPVTVSFPEASPTPTTARLPLATLLVPLALAGVLALVMRSPTMLLFGLTGPALSLTTWWSERRRGRRGGSDHDEHEAAVAAARSQLEAACARDRADIDRAHPPAAAVLAMAERRSAGLWSGALEVRIGVGHRPARVRVTGATGSPVPAHADAPVTVDLRQAGILWICGPRARALRMAQTVLGRLAVGRSPAELEVHVLVDSARHADEWDSTGYLPHLCGRHLATEPDALLARLAVVADEAAAFTADGRPAGTSGTGSASRRVRAPPQQPLLVLFVDGAHALRVLRRVDGLLRQHPDRAVTVVVDPDGDPLAHDDGAVLDVGSTPARLTMRHPVVASAPDHLDDGAGDDAAHHAGDGVARVTDLVPDLPSPCWWPRLARALAPLRDARSTGSERGMPQSVRLLDLVEAHTLEALTDAWSSSARSSTRVVLGATAGGRLEVDLSAEGPHVLVGGTTGAGKSELLQTMVCSLALAHRPDELSLLLLDYKGGAAFRGCARLPHVAGLVTDLDAHLTARALVSLAAEVRRRERLLADTGAASLDEYHARRAANPHLLALPRLVIVIDEFRVLAEELPEFVHGLVRLAAVGRSLGVHLVLATQRPGGIVSADIRANVSLRIALRVRDRADSTDVLDAPDAAQIGATTPGRAYLRGAVTALTEFQTAQVTSRAPVRAGLTLTDASSWWDPPPPAAPAAARPAGASDLDRIVEATRTASTTLRLPVPAPPWLPPLPETVAAQSITAPAGSVAVGLEDDPAAQRQAPWCWNPSEGGLGFAGGSRSGRTTAALTVALGLAAAHPPTTVHLYVLGPGELEALSGLPHTATVTPIDDADRIRLVIERLRDVARNTRDTTTVVVVDGWEQLAAVAHGALAADLRSLLETGGSAGLRAVVTGGRAVLAGQLVALLGRRLVLPVGDPVELALAGIPAKAVPQHQPPGRGLDPRTRHEVQVATYAEPIRVVEGIAAAWATYADSPNRPSPVLPLPFRVAREELSSTVPLALGLREGDLATVGFDPATGHRRLIVVGPPRSGRTTALAALAHSLVTAGPPLAIVGTDLGRLTARIAQVRLVVDGRDDADRDALIELRRAYPTLAVLVDDAERVAGLPIEPVLLEIVRRVDEASGLVAAAASPPGADGRGGAFLTELARAHTGLVLAPAAGTVLLGSVLPSVARHPGRGVLVADGTTTRVQVANHREVRP